MNRVCIALLTCLFTIGCDPQPTSQDTAGKPSKAPATTKGPADEGAADGAVKFDSLSSCLQSCEGGNKIPTNRETCRLNCDAAYGAPAGTPGGDKIADPVGTATSCLGRCYSGEATPDPCAMDCKSAAAATPSAPAAAVLDQLGVCVRSCHADNSVLPTNRATCELNCAQSARVAGPATP